MCAVALLDPLLSDYPRLSQQRKLIASVVVAGFDRVKIAGRRQQAAGSRKRSWEAPENLNLSSIESFAHNFCLDALWAS